MIDQALQLGYKAAYRMMRVYWAVRRPDTHGALVAIWHQQRILLVQNSYVPYRSLPGGYVKSSETGRQAALRELREEINLEGIEERQLQDGVDVVHEWEGKTDHVEIFRLELEEAPQIDVDNREVIDAGFYTPEAALGLWLFPPLAQHIRERMAEGLSAASSDSI